MIIYLVSCKITKLSTNTVESILPLIAWASEKKAEAYAKLLNNPTLRGAESEYIKVEYFISEVPFVENLNDSDQI